MSSLLKKKQIYFIVIVLIVAFSLRVGYAFLAKIVPYADAKHYDRIAISILSGKGYAQGSNLGDDERALAYAPLYPLLLAIFYKIFKHNYSVIWMFQAIVGIINCILIYLIAKKVFSRKAALFAIIISAFFFHFILYSAMLLTETIYIFFILLFFLFLFDIIEFFPPIKYTTLGILAGLLILTRPNFIVFVIFLFFWELRRKLFKEALAFIICLSLIILPWIIRNYIVYQRFIFISTAGAENFWTGNHPKATGEELAYSEEMKINPENLAPLKLISQGYGKGAKFIVQNPVQSLKLILRKTSLFFSLLRTDGWWPHMKGWHIVIGLIFSLFFTIFLFSLGTIGFIFSYRNNDSYKFWMRSFIIISFLTLLPFIIEARYRFPIYPFVIIFTGYGLTLLPELKSLFKVKEKSTLYYLKISAILIAILLVNSIYDSALNLETIRSNLKLLF